MAITGELFIRSEKEYPKPAIIPVNETEDIKEDEEKLDEEQITVQEEERLVRTFWAFDELILEEVKTREEEHRESLQRMERQRFDFSPYERFF
jgi:hypothetical protein